MPVAIAIETILGGVVVLSHGCRSCILVWNQGFTTVVGITIAIAAAASMVFLCHLGCLGTAEKIEWPVETRVLIGCAAVVEFAVLDQGFFIFRHGSGRTHQTASKASSRRHDKTNTSALQCQTLQLVCVVVTLSRCHVVTSSFV